MLYCVFFANQDAFSPEIDFRKAEVKQQKMPFSAENITTLVTIRDEMIAFSEEYMKRRYGPRIFGKLLFSRCEEQSLFYDKFVIDDNGFAPEAEYILDQVGAPNSI